MEDLYPVDPMPTEVRIAGLWNFSFCSRRRFLEAKVIDRSRFIAVGDVLSRERPS